MINDVQAKLSSRKWRLLVRNDAHKVHNISDGKEYTHDYGLTGIS